MQNNRIKSVAGLIFKVFSGLSVTLQGFYLEVVVYVSSLVFITLFLIFVFSFEEAFVFSAIVFFISILIWTKSIKIKSEKVKKILNYFAKTIKIIGSFIVLYYLLNLVFNPSNYLVQKTLPLIKFLEDWANKAVIGYIVSYGFFVIYGIIIVWLFVKLKNFIESRAQNKKIEKLIAYLFAIIFLFGFAFLLSLPIFKENFDYFFDISYPYLKWFLGFSVFSLHLIYLSNEFKKLLISKTQIPFSEK